MAVAGVGAVALRSRWLSQLIIRPLNGWRRCSSASMASSSAQGTDPSKKLRTSFMLFVDERKKASGLPAFRNIVERSKYFSEQWKQLSEPDKERYKAVAAQNLAEYYDDRNKNEMPEQLALQKEQKRLRVFQMHAKSLKKERELNHMPPKPCTAYAHFISHVAKSKRRGDAPQSDFIRGASQQWKLMAAEDRQPYINAAAEQRSKYEADMNDWEKRMEAEGKGHLIPGREPLLNIPRKSPFAQAVIKAVEATTNEALSKNTVNGILNFIGEKLSTIEKADQLDAQQIIKDFAREWEQLQPGQRRRYCRNPSPPHASPARGDQRPDDKAHEGDSRDIKHGASKRSAKGTGPSASTADGNEREPAEQMTASALKQKGTGGRPRKEPVGKSDVPAAQVEAVDVLQTKTIKSEGQTAAAKPPRQKQKRRPVDSNTTSDDSD